MEKTIQHIKDERFSEIVKTTKDVWKSFEKLVSNHTDGHLADAMKSGLRELTENYEMGRKIAISWDPETHSFASQLHSVRPVLSSDQHKHPLFELELFWCSLGGDEFVAGYRLLCISDADDFAVQWLQDWIEFTESEKLKTHSKDWNSVPSFLKNHTIICASGRVNLGANTEPDWQQRAAEAENDLQYQEQANDGLRQRISRLVLEVNRLKNGQVENSTSALSTIPEYAGQVIPWTDLSQLDDWAHQNQDRIVVLTRALKGASKSDYEEPETVRKALEFLAGSYRNCKLGLQDRKMMEAELLEAGLKLDLSIKKSAANNEGDDYFISWRGERRFMDMHLCKGNSREPRYCLRIYFFWCEDVKKVVIGWLPSHLNNSIT